jgi:hypothetical protein
VGSDDAVVALQRAAGNRAVTALLVARQEQTTTAAPARTPEERARLAFVDDATRELEVPLRTRDVILAALESFSAAQLALMRRAGVRFWGTSGVPPAFEGMVEAPALASHGAFIPGIRIIRIGANTGRHALVHELAHAWDYVQGLARPRRLDDLRPGARRRQIGQDLRRPPFRSASSRRLRTVELGGDGGPRRVRLTLRQMWQRYRDRVPRREEAFDGPSTREGHSLRSPQEFYAEGYAVFHGPHELPKERLQRYAPELHALLEAESGR